MSRSARRRSVRVSSRPGARSSSEEISESGDGEEGVLVFVGGA